MTGQFESSFLGANNTELFYQQWICPEAKGNIILTHGLAEHSEAYTDFAEKLNKLKWNVFAWDLRGHGRSEGKRGYVEAFDHFIEDLHLFINEVQNKHNKNQLPTLLFGHSLGGLITIKTVICHPELNIAGLILSAPGLGLALAVHPLKIKFAELGAKWLPKVTLWNEIQYKDLTRDEDYLKQYPKDPLRHDKISPRLYLGMVEAFDFVAKHAEEIKIPLILQIAGNDRLINPQSQIDFFEKVGSPKKEIHIYEDSLHEIYKDLDRDEAHKDLSQFLNQLKV